MNKKIHLHVSSYRNRLTPELYNALLKADNYQGPKDEVPPLDFDPFTGTQEEMAVKSLLGGEPVGDKATVSVGLQYKDEPDGKIISTFEVNLVMQKDGWKISDVNYGYSLLDFLRKSYP